MDTIEFVVKMDVKMRWWVKPILCIAEFIFFLVGRFGAVIKVNKMEKRKP